MPETILLLQDNASKAAIVRETLVKSSDPPFVVEWVRSCAAALDRLHDQTRDHIRAVLIDLLLPDGQELEIFDQIFQASPHIPILVLSNPEHEEVARQAVQRGAQDYILDNRLDSYSLSKALRNMLERTANARGWPVVLAMTNASDSSGFAKATWLRSFVPGPLSIRVAPRAMNFVK